MKSQAWFKSMDCLELNILKYKSVSDDKLVADVVIKNKDAIKEIMDRISSLPVDAGEMVKWGPKTPRTVLTFQCGDKSIQEIQVFGSRFKTPSTGFVSEKNVTEENLSRDIDALTEPGLNKRILKVKDHSVKFKNFVIKYVGADHTPQDPNGPTSGPTNRVHFDIFENSSANTVSVGIFDGQIPPQPQPFVVEKKIYYLLTYQNGAKESLSPKYFEVSDKLPKRR